MVDRRFKWLLWLLPAAFREEHGREILRVWRDESSDAVREGRRGVWRRAFTDTLRVAPREYIVTWSHNLVIACRSLRKAPAFALTAILTLGLGTGATAAVFSLISGVVIRPLAWRAPEQVGLLWAVPPIADRTWLSPPEVDDMRHETSSFTAVAAFTDLRFALVRSSATIEVQAVAISHNFLRLLGVPPAIGRDFTADDDHRTAARAVMLSDAFWRTHFGGDPRVVGQTVRLNDDSYTVIGVFPPFEWLPASSVLPATVDVWVAIEPHLPARDRSVRFVHALARLRGDVTFAAANAELNSYAVRVQQQFATAYTGGQWTFAIVPFQDDVLREARTPLFVLFALVTLVLVMACANVANLLLARGEQRRAELALRASLGAGPARLAGELLAESVVLAAFGSAIGVGFAAVVPRVLRTLDPAALPRLDGVGIDWRVGTLMLALVLLTSIIFAFLPLMERLRLKTSTTPMTVRDGGRSPAAVRLGKQLVIVQTALATMVLIATVFLADTFQRLQRIDIGMDTSGLATARLTVFSVSQGISTTERFENALASVTRLPNVVRAGAVSQLPLSGAMLGSSFLAADRVTPRRMDVDLRGVAGDYFGAAGISLLRGRGFDTRDTAASVAVAVVDETLARMLAIDGDVIGQQIRWSRQPDTAIEIVGVVRGVRHRSVADTPRATVYRPISQYPRSSMYFVVRTAFDPVAMTDRIVSAIAASDPLLAIADVAAMEDRVAKATSRAKTSVMLAATIAGLALVLALVGVYGVLSFGVSHRRREFGIRLAVGATPRRVRTLIVREGLLLSMSGTAMGIVGSWLLVRAAGAILYGSHPSDIVPYVIGTAIVVLCSVVAFWLPARRASAVSPIAALRAE
jgi:predicted permease